jgi:GNAT superfamily N-acetyltransferase
LVEQVRPEVTYRLRQEVLRPGRPPETAFFAGDRDRSSGHFAAYVDDEVVGVVSVMADPESDGPGFKGQGVWHLRGMAVDPEQQGTGVGAALIARLRDFVQRSGGGLIWCNARVSAKGFYERQGFIQVGDPWEEPYTGPHIRMHDSRTQEAEVPAVTD